jgi:hypothetical protein
MPLDKFFIKINSAYLYKVAESSISSQQEH